MIKLSLFLPLKELKNAVTAEMLELRAASATEKKSERASKKLSKYQLKILISTKTFLIFRIKFFNKLTYFKNKLNTNHLIVQMNLLQMILLYK